MGSFDALTGKPGCPAVGVGEFALSEQPETTCSGAPSILARDSLTVTRVRNGTVSSFLLNVLDSNNNLIPEFTSIPLRTGEPVPLTNLTVDITGPNPRYSLVLVNMTGTPVVDLLFKYIGPGPTLCFKAVSPASVSETTVPFLVSIGGNGTTGLNTSVDVVKC